MVTQVNIAEAKAQLSRLVDAAERGDSVVIARSGRPVARLLALETPEARELGFVQMHVPDDFFEPLSGDDLAAWE